MDFDAGMYNCVSFDAPDMVFCVALFASEIACSRGFYFDKAVGDVLL